MKFENQPTHNQYEKSSTEQKLIQPEQIFQQKEAFALEKNPNSKLKKAFLTITSALILANSTPTFASERGSTIETPVERTYVQKQQELSEKQLIEKIQLEHELSSEKINAEEAAPLITFAAERGVPFTDLKEALLNRDEGSDPLLLLEAYAIAYDAVHSNALNAEQHEIFVQQILPNLKNGVLNVEKSDPGKHISASYDSERDTYTDADIRIFDLHDRAITIHELTHAAQDGAALTQERKDSEYEAYLTQHEYILLQRGDLRKNSEGLFIMPKIIFDNVGNIYQKILFLEKALHNARNGHNELNTITMEETDLSALNTEEAIQFYELYNGTLIDIAKSQWSLSSSFVGMFGGKFIDTDETLEKDGFKRTPNENKN